MTNKFRTMTGKSADLPIFFPDATRAVVRGVDSEDIKETMTPGVLVNTYHLYYELGEDLLNKHKSIRNFMNWDGALISDSGGFQVMSIVKVKGNPGKVIDEGVVFYPTKKQKVLLSPEKSISYQFMIGSDLMVVLDDFTPPGSTRKQAEITVRRTVEWAKRCKIQFDIECEKRQMPENERPYLIGVVQGGTFKDLRRECASQLAEIGFDGFGYGGWPIDKHGDFDIDTAKLISENTPDSYLLYGLGIGKPEDIAACYKLGYSIFDCVLPTRDARHGRLYVYNFDSIPNIRINGDFYGFVYPGKRKNMGSIEPVSKACDCQLCRNYSLGYLAHLFSIKDTSALRLATIHNLRFYSLLMEKLRANPVMLKADQ